MADASSVRNVLTGNLPNPSGRNAGQVRYIPATGQFVGSNGAAWLLFTGAEFQVQLGTWPAGAVSATVDPVVGTAQWFIADREMSLSAVKVAAAGAGSSLAAATFDITVVRAATNTAAFQAAPTYTAGNSIFAAPVDLTSATGAVVAGAAANQTLSATAANLVLQPGDALYVTVAATGKTAGQAIGGTTHVGSVTVSATY